MTDKLNPVIFQTFLHMHVYSLYIQLFFFPFFSLWNRWIWILNDAVSNSILPRNESTNQRSVFFRFVTKFILCILWKNGKPDFILESINDKKHYEWLPENWLFAREIPDLNYFSDESFLRWVIQISDESFFEERKLFRILRDIPSS